MPPLQKPQSASARPYDQHFSTPGLASPSNWSAGNSGSPSPAPSDAPFANLNVPAYQYLPTAPPPIFNGPPPGYHPQQQGPPYPFYQLQPALYPGMHYPPAQPSSLPFAPQLPPQQPGYILLGYRTRTNSSTAVYGPPGASFDDFYGKVYWDLGNGKRRYIDPRDQHLNEGKDCCELWCS